ncbi:DUF5634 family protein [Niallia oryzisoli]|uniref:DUF5634 family protein n=1 Tax=Niallia oryzisoli TaxID=1737571 RepID=A0ABZ2CIS1_9BACI
MEYLTREQIINDLQQSFQPYIDKFDIEDIGIFEEEGQDDQYFIGYTARKEGKTYHIHTPFKKNNHGELTPIKNEWTIESDEPEREDIRGFKDVESALREI